MSDSDDNERRIPEVTPRTIIDRQVLASGEVPDEMIEAMPSAKMDPRHRHLDDLVKDWTP
ncbi:MAG: hypothetical protein P4M05_33485 [Bradyrhizobium sp.]|nr:hypothetical protein [Bradyrhizobium sp.]